MADFECEVLKVFFTKEINAKSKIELRVAKWGDKPPMLEYRRFYKTNQGVWKVNRNVGIDEDIWKKVVQNNKEISKLLGGEK